MKKIIKNNEAVGRGTIAVGAIIVAIIIIAAIFVVYSGGTPYWETETVFGVWQDELVIEFEDGSMESLKIIQEDITKPFTVYYEDKVILGVSLKLSATASGEGYDGAELQTTGFGYDGYVKKDGAIKHSWVIQSTKTHNIPIDTTKLLVQSGIQMTTINNNPNKYPSGIYTIEFYPRGTVQYRGYPNSEDWVTAILPPDRSIIIDVDNTPPASIVITLSSDV